MTVQDFLLRIRKLAKRSWLLRNLYSLLRDSCSGLRTILHRIRNLRDLVTLYGFRRTFHLYRMDRASWRRCSLINERINSLVSQMARGEYIDGSATRCGWLYHDYALPETRLKAHRRETSGRLLLLKKHLPIYKARILDIGCSSGGIALGLALLGALKVVGVDHDQTAIRVGIAIAEKYEIHNVEFRVSPLSKFEVPEVDVIIWLSQWMWVVKQHGLEYAKDLLFEIPRQSGASVMIFESAADDGKAAIPGTTQSDIEDFLHSWTPFSLIRSIGSFDDKWRPPSQERIVFACSEPRFTWQGKEATITRIDSRTIVKEFEPQRLWAKDWETRCLQRLDRFPHFPKLLDVGRNSIKMEWAGNRVTKPSQLDQLSEIVRILSKSGIVHRDICPENLLYREGQLFLVDFGWAIVDGEEPPATPAEGLGRGFYTFGEWNDARAAERVCAWFEKQGR